MYSIAGIVALLVLVICNYDILFNRNYKAHNHRALKAYKGFLVSLSLYFICDICWGYLSDLENKTPVFICTTIYFILMAGTLFMWTLFVAKYVEKSKVFSKVMKIVGYIFVLAGNAVAIINIFHTILFSYTEGVYVTKITRYLLYGSQIALFSMSSLYAIITAIRGKDYRKGQMATIATVGFFMSIAISFQMFEPELPIYTAGCAIGVVFIHVFIVMAEKDSIKDELYKSQAQELRSVRERDRARRLAYIDPLTGVKNKHAFVELENKMDEEIHDGDIDQFALLIFDLNDLKVINDTFGHDAGDRYINKSVDLIKKYFPDEEIYRYGGDEFVLILKGEKYENRYQKLDEFNKNIEENLHSNEPVVASGLSDFVREKDNVLRNVFTRADERMYANKRRLKQIKAMEEGDFGNKAIGGTNFATLRQEMYELFYHNRSISLVDMLNNSNCDEILEIDTKNDAFQRFYHVDGKYFLPNVQLTYLGLIDYTSKYIVHPDDKGIYDAMMNPDGFFDRLKNNPIPNFDVAHFRYKLQDGQYRYVEQVVIAGEEFGIAEGSFRLYVSDIQNIKSRQIGASSSENVAVGRDSITGLLAGKDFFIAAENKISKSKNTNWCLLSIDIEHFKFFDEWFGREKGDELLGHIGTELKKFEDENNAVSGYSGGDDFVVLLEYDEEKIQKLYQAIHGHIGALGFSTGFLPAFGISMIAKDMLLVDAFDRSTIAMLRAKDSLKQRICTYNYDMQFLAEKEYRTLTNFIRALQNDEVDFYLQPQVKLETNQIVGAEALARWIAKDGEVIIPGDFVPVLEKYGFITDLDKRIWEKVFAWIKKYTESGHKTVPISLNLSQVDIFNIDVVNYLVDLTHKYQVSPKLVKVEITESTYAESMEVIDKLVKDLRKHGFTVMLDDFGSGYSSLNMLSTLKLDCIKLDAKFLHVEKSNHEKGIHILESVVNMAKMMALPIIVEGAETKEQCDFLKELGVNYVQGFYFYKPMPVKEFENIIKDEKRADFTGFTFKANEQFRLREFLDANVYSDSMLNSILGAVAIYSWDKEHVDIVRFNQQFYEDVGVPGFAERLENIEQFVPEEERPRLFKTLKEAKDHRLTGASNVFKFLRPDGTYASFEILFYYVGKKDGCDRFYGSANNVTELTTLREAKDLVAQYSQDNIIFVKRVSGEWHYSVMSHALSDEIGLSPKELEEELNSGKFPERVVNRKELAELMKTIEKEIVNKSFKSVEHVFTIISTTKQKVQVVITVDRVGNEQSNLEYLLRSRKYTE